jgi:hypothetical protein
MTASTTLTPAADQMTADSQSAPATTIETTPTEAATGIAPAFRGW